MSRYMSYPQVYSCISSCCAGGKLGQNSGYARSICRRAWTIKPGQLPELSSAVALLSAFALPAFATQVNVTYDSFYDNAATSLSQLTWNSPLCGTCWNLEYTTPTGTLESIYITAVDTAYTYNLSLEAFNTLTDNTGVAAGKVTATATQVATSFCGM
ncbi:hypothetical protein EDB19DRAFT_1803133 [Suillus lakei]|nr:hypothetical protein EDB19DRAFT_1803133 [Suillus lakei]